MFMFCTIPFLVSLLHPEIRYMCHIHNHQHRNWIQRTLNWTQIHERTMSGSIVNPHDILWILSVLGRRGRGRECTANRHDDMQGGSPSAKSRCKTRAKTRTRAELQQGPEPEPEPQPEPQQESSVRIPTARGRDISNTCRSLGTLIFIKSRSWIHKSLNWAQNHERTMSRSIENNTTSIGRSVHMHCMMYSECIHAIHRIHRFHWFYGCQGLHDMEIDSMESLEFILASDQMCLVKWLLNTSITGNLPRKQSRYSHMCEISKKSNLYTTSSGNSWIGWIDRLGTFFNVLHMKNNVFHTQKLKSLQKTLVFG